MLRWKQYVGFLQEEDEDKDRDNLKKEQLLNEGGFG
jgi:hypothetical protein